MSLQICLNCRELGMTWYIDGEEQTWWSCSECKFKIEEDESKVSCCGICNFSLPTVSWLVKGNEGFYWCFNCNKETDQIKVDKNDYKAWMEIIEKMDQ